MAKVMVYPWVISGHESTPRTPEDHGWMLLLLASTLPPTILVALDVPIPSWGS